MSKNNQITLNDTSYDYRGSGYTKAFIAVDRMRDDKFIGYIPTKDEWIIATKFTDGAYGWSKYFMDLDSLIEHLNELSRNSYSLSVVNFIEEFQGDYETQLILNTEAI